MKLIRRVVPLLISLSLLLPVPAFAEEAKEEQPVAIAHHAVDGITIDGILNEWNLSDPINITEEVQVIRDVQAWGGPEDLSCTVYVMWDEENLYLGVDVKEDTPYGAIEMLPLDGEDNFKLYLSTDPGSDPARTVFATNDFLIYLIIDNLYWDTAIDRSMVPKEARQRFVSNGMNGGQNVLEGYTVASTQTTGGFLYEALIPWACFSNENIPVYVPAAGDSISFDFAITDISYPCPGTQYIPQMAWTGDLNINEDPSLWGQLVLQ